MSRHHRKNLKRGIKQPLVPRILKPRAERHGEPRKVRHWFRVEEIVAPGTPNAKRSVETRDPEIVYPADTIEVDGLVVVYRLLMDRFKWIPRPEGSLTMVAAGATATVGKVNTGGDVKKKPAVLKGKK